MNVSMSETTFNLVGAMLMSDINVPVKDATGYAVAQQEWAAAAKEANDAAKAADVTQEVEGELV